MMKSVLKNLCLVLLLTLSLASCKDETSVQNYFVTHQDLPDFKQIDLSASLVDFSKMKLTSEQQEAISSFKKINFIGYKVKDDDLIAYKSELNKAKALFKNEKYNELMEFSSNGSKFRINTLGDGDTVDEILILMSSNTKGFGIARILGDDMNPNKMVEMFKTMEKADINKDQLEDIINFFK